MLDDTRTASIEAAIHAQEAQGQEWTNLSIYNVVGGNYAELSQYLKARRAQTRREGGAPVAVAEEPSQPQEPTTLEEELRGAVDAEQYAEARLSTLEEKATREMLSAAEEIEVLRLERRLGTLASVITRLHREIDQQKEVVDIEAFVQAWLPTVEAKRALYERFAEAVRDLWQSMQAIAAQHDAQVEGLQQLPTRLQRYMLDTFLPDRGTMLARLAQQMGHPAWSQVLLSPTPSVATAEDLMANDPGCLPLPPRLIQNAINASQPVDRSA